jgi:hypothetical protein
MKNRNIHYRTTIPALLLSLALTCLTGATAQPPPRSGGGTEGSAIVGLWRVHYSGDFVLDSFDQWFPGGLEWESANLGLGVLCQGTWIQMPRRMVKLFHVNWNYDANGALIGYSYEIQINTVSQDGNSYEGTYDFKDYDVNGNFLSEETGTVTATRLSVNTPQ